MRQFDYYWTDRQRITNYVTLIDQLRRYRGRDPVLLVTFNYDRMLENALQSVNITIGGLPDYIRYDDFKLFKLHGSVHWGREVEILIPDIGGLNVWAVANQLISQAETVKVTDRFHLVQDYPIGKIDNIPLFPAIAIPVETKSDFECPQDHLDCLAQHLSRVDRIVIIGWRAAESHFLAILKEKLPSDIPVQVVAGKKTSAEDILEKVQRFGIRASGHAVEGGFTEYVVSREAERFFNSG